MTKLDCTYAYKHHAYKKHVSDFKKDFF